MAVKAKNFFIDGSSFWLPFYNINIWNLKKNLKKNEKNEKKALNGKNITFSKEETFWSLSSLYKFKDKRYELYFQKNINKFCRGEQCGLVNEIYKEENLTPIDKCNIKLIKEVENEY